MRPNPSVRNTQLYAFSSEQCTDLTKRCQFVTVSAFLCMHNNFNQTLLNAITTIKFMWLNSATLPDEDELAF